MVAPSSSQTASFERSCLKRSMKKNRPRPIKRATFRIPMSQERTPVQGISSVKASTTCSKSPIIIATSCFLA